MKTSERNWFRTLFGSAISAMAGAGSGFLGMNGAHGLGIDVPTLNFKSLGVLLLTSGLASIFLFLKQSPLPPDDIDTQTTITETTTQESVSPRVDVQTKVTEISKEKIGPA